EFTRLAIPRRVYTQSHFDMVVDAIAAVWERRSEIKRGYKIVWGPSVLRHFQASLAPAED
ncbi:MAG TPA: tyrosine phenol-lyase, partial [Candidatus Scatomorpha merdipullorum]|nr:tyrosine phenol-lyase [Candidatus Scatomorpha merdipullorum]